MHSTNAEGFRQFAAFAVVDVGVALRGLALPARSRATVMRGFGQCTGLCRPLSPEVLGV